MAADRFHDEVFQRQAWEAEHARLVARARALRGESAAAFRRAFADLWHALRRHTPETRTLRAVRAAARALRRTRRGR